MASKMLRRSGVAVGLEAERMGWLPNLVIQVGVGFKHEEMNVLHEEWPDCKFIGFEAHPGIATKVKDYPGELRSMAISNRFGITNFYEKPKHKDGSSVFRFKEDILAREIDPVLMSTLDRELPDIIGTEAVLWLDCEGSELRALQGAEKLLQTVKMVNVEMTPRPPSENWPTPVQIHKQLRMSGFYRAWLHTMKGGQYDAIYVKPEIFKKELCCCPYTVQEFEKEQEF